MQMKDQQRALILTTLAYHKGNRTDTARELGMPIRTLRNWIKRLREKGFDTYDTQQVRWALERKKK